VGLRLRSNEARRPFALKPSGRWVFCIGASLSRASQPAAGMLRPFRLAPIQNPKPQHLSQFSDRLLMRLDGIRDLVTQPGRDALPVVRLRQPCASVFIRGRILFARGSVFRG
jgi:hypothetical protein